MSNDVSTARQKLTKFKVEWIVLSSRGNDLTIRHIQVMQGVLYIAYSN